MRWFRRALNSVARFLLRLVGCKRIDPKPNIFHLLCCSRWKDDTTRPTEENHLDAMIKTKNSGLARTHTVRHVGVMKRPGPGDRRELGRINLSQGQTEERLSPSRDISVKAPVLLVQRLVGSLHAEFGSY